MNEPYSLEAQAGARGLAVRGGQRAKQPVDQGQRREVYPYLRGLLLSCRAMSLTQVGLVGIAVRTAAVRRRNTHHFRVLRA